VPFVCFQLLLKPKVGLIQTHQPERTLTLQTKSFTTRSELTTGFNAQTAVENYKIILTTTLTYRLPPPTAASEPEYTAEYTFVYK